MTFRQCDTIFLNCDAEIVTIKLCHRAHILKLYYIISAWGFDGETMARSTQFQQTKSWKRLGKMAKKTPSISVGFVQFFSEVFLLNCDVIIVSQQLLILLKGINRLHYRLQVRKRIELEPPYTVYSYIQ